MKRNLSLAIVHLLHSAREHIQYPKIRLQGDTGDEFPIQLSVAGPNATFPHSINITDGRSYGSNTYYGRIRTDGTLQFSSQATRFAKNVVERELETFANDPAGYAKLYSNGTGNCMFCAKQLTDPQSVVVGYGPICAAHFNLPHGSVKGAASMVEVEHDLADFELEPVEDVVKLDVSLEPPQQFPDEPLIVGNIYKGDKPLLTPNDLIADLQRRVVELEKLVIQLIGDKNAI